MNWYALYTKPRWEKKVAASLQKNNHEYYLPLKKEKKQWSDRKKIVELPILPSYIFVRIDSSKLTDIRFIDGIVNYVYWQGKPALVRDKEIEELKNFLAQEGEINIEHITNTVGDIITLHNKPFENQSAVITRIEKNSVELLLASLGIKLILKKR